jgi:hypothetical protein
MMRTISLVGVAAVVLLACSPPSTARQARNPNVITKEEILNSHVFNAYDVVSMLRPNFLHSRGATTILGSDTGYPKVYLNRIYYGPLESLRTMDISAIREIHYYNAGEASGRFGLGNASGAIEVITDALN